jgi:hypothetical protein
MQQRKSEGANRIGWTFYNNVVVSDLKSPGGVVVSVLATLSKGHRFEPG